MAIKFHYRETHALLITIKDLSDKFSQLATAGVTCLAIEQSYFSIMEILLQLNGVKKNDVAADHLTAPVFEYLDGSASLKECLTQLESRFNEVRNERRNRIEANNDRGPAIVRSSDAEDQIAACQV